MFLWTNKPEGCAHYEQTVTFGFGTGAGIRPPSGQDDGTHDSHTPHGGYPAKDSAERAATRRGGDARAGRDIPGRPVVVWRVYFGTWEGEGSRASRTEFTKCLGGTSAREVVPGRRGT